MLLVVVCSLVISSIIVLVSICSVLIGTIGALAQLSWKRFIAFGSIVHAGFILVALLSADRLALSAIVLYLVSYGLLTLGLVGMLSNSCSLRSAYNSSLANSANSGLRYIAQYNGMLYTQPIVMLLVLLLLFNMIGLPPTLGFHSKLMLTIAILGGAHLLSALIIVLLKVSSALYYLRVLAMLMVLNESALVRVLVIPGSSVVGFLVLVVMVSLLPYMKPVLFGHLLTMMLW